MIERALRERDAVISFQVAQEFLNVATRKFAVPLQLQDAQRYLEVVLAPLCEVWPTVQLYREALGLRAETGFGFYDSLIVAAALSAGCNLLLSEDLQDDRRVRGLRIDNPFAA